MSLLTLGSIVKLKNGNRKLMIISRTPLFNDHGTIGYFEYAGCLYPNGQTGQETYFFNQENIEEVIFEGYSDNEEEEFCKQYEKALENLTYPKLQARI